MILTRLAVDKEHQRKGLGQALLKDALLRTAQAADIAGIRCLLVHAKDDAAQQWYESWEFEPNPTDPYHLFGSQGYIELRWCLHLRARLSPVAHPTAQAGPPLSRTA